MKRHATTIAALAGALRRRITTFSELLGVLLIIGGVGDLFGGGWALIVAGAYILTASVLNGGDRGSE